MPESTISFLRKSATGDDYGADRVRAVFSQRRSATIVSKS